MQVKTPNTAIILAGGKGSRMLDITNDEYSKVLVNVQGKPVLHHILETLNNCGISRCVLALGHHASGIASFISSIDLPSGLRVEFVKELAELGTAGAARYARDQFEITDPFLLVNGDTLVDFQLGKLMKSTGFPNDMVMCLCKRPDLHRNRVVETGCDGIVTNTTLYPSDTISSQLETLHLVNTGVYLLHPTCLDLVPSSSAFGMSDLLDNLTKLGRVFATNAANVYFNVGTKADIDEAEMFWKKSVHDNQLPYIEAKSWGSKKTLSVTDKYSVVRLQFNVGGSTSLHLHKFTEKSHYILSGVFHLLLNENVVELRSGDEITIKPGVKHRLVAQTQGAILEVTTEGLDEEDIVRLESITSIIPHGSIA